MSAKHGKIHGSDTQKRYRVCIVLRKPPDQKFWNLVYRFLVFFIENLQIDIKQFIQENIH